MLARLLGARMAERGSGHIVLMSSLSGKVGTPGGAALQRDEVRPARLRAGAARRPAPQRRRRQRGLPGFISRRGHVRRLGRAACRPASARVTPEDVADAVVRAIERNNGEVDVAPAHIRLGAVAANVVPEIAATVSRKLGAERVADDYDTSSTVRR